MYETIRNHPTVREIWAGELELRGILDEGEAEAMFEEIMADMAEVQKKPTDELKEEDFATDELYTPLVCPRTAVAARSRRTGPTRSPRELPPNSKLDRPSKDRGISPMTVARRSSGFASCSKTAPVRSRAGHGGGTSPAPAVLYNA